MYNDLDMPLEALLNFCAEAAKIEDAEESEEALPFVSMTSCVIPPKVLFEAHWKVCCRDKLFNITPGAGQTLPFYGDFTCDEMWDIINETVKEDVLDFDDEDSAINLCSSVMYLLRFEWI